MNKYIKTIFTLAITLLFGCTEYGVRVVQEFAPEIEVYPLEHDFGPVSADGAPKDLSIQLTNVGNASLDLHGAFLLNGSTNFSLSSLLAFELPPGEATQLTVTYDPITYEINGGAVSILSNDEDEGEVLVFLQGSGDAPVIEITPESYDFGTTFLGCDDELDITISNVGNVDLEISDLEYFSTVPVDFQMNIDYGVLGQLPWILIPGDSTTLTTDYVPLDLLDDEAYLEVTSNDPIRPLVKSEHEGLGDYQSYVTDTHEQSGELTSDILFVVDNSCSMSGNQTNLKNNFDDFIAVFSGAGVDYHIAVVTTDDAEFVGDIITSATADPVAEFVSQINLIGYWGYGIEKGLWFSYVATDTGGDAAPGSSNGFFRSDAKLVVIYVSDEPDFSTSLSGSSGSTTMVYADYVNHLKSLKSSSDLVVAHAVAGDYPSGCTANGGASFGAGYYDVVNDLGGTFMSICDTDWSVTMEAVASDSMAGATFALSQIPFEDTITVAVDGVSSIEWTYNSVYNTVQFNTSFLPSEGSIVDITYAIWGDCEDEEEEE